MDIGISMKKRVLEYLKQHGSCSWGLGVERGPKKSGKGYKLFVAINGYWEGYFIIDELDRLGYKHHAVIFFRSESWHELEPKIPTEVNVTRGASYTYKTPKVES